MSLELEIGSVFFRVYNRRVYELRVKSIIHLVNEVERLYVVSCNSAFQSTNFHNSAFPHMNICNSAFPHMNIRNSAFRHIMIFYNSAFRYGQVEGPDDYRGSCYILSNDPLCYSTEEEAQAVRLHAAADATPVFYKGAALFRASDKITGFVVCDVQKDQDVDLWTCKEIGDNHKVILSSRLDNIFMDRKSAGLFVAKYQELVRISRLPRVVQATAPAFSIGDAIYDLDDEYTRCGKVLDVRAWPSQCGWLYYCEDSARNKYVVHSINNIYPSREELDAAVRKRTPHHSKFNVDQIVYYVDMGSRIHGYRIYAVVQRGDMVEYYNVTSMENNGSWQTTFESDNVFLFGCRADAENFVEIRKFEEEYLQGVHGDAPTTPVSPRDFAAACEPYTPDTDQRPPPVVLWPAVPPTSGEIAAQVASALASIQAATDAALARIEAAKTSAALPCIGTAKTPRDRRAPKRFKP